MGPTVHRRKETEMPDPKFVQPWHGVPREEIDWHPRLDQNLCMGCGLCVTTCGRGVYLYDYEREKPVVAQPLHCMVGCVTCANICPDGAITFPPLQQLHKLIRAKKVLVRTKKEELPARKQALDARTEAGRAHA